MNSYRNLFANADTEDSQQNTDMQELRIRAPAEVDLAALAKKLDTVDGVEVELDEANEGPDGAPEPDSDDDQPEGDQSPPDVSGQAVAQQARTAGDVADSMTWGVNQNAGERAAADQLEQHARDPDADGDATAYKETEADADQVSSELDSVVESMQFGGGD